MLEITLSNGRTIQVIGMAAQHRRLLREIFASASVTGTGEGALGSRSQSKTGNGNLHLDGADPPAPEDS